MAIVFWDVRVEEETLRSPPFCRDAEEENFFVDNEDNLPSELNDLDFDESENECEEPE